MNNSFANCVTMRSVLAIILIQLLCQVFQQVNGQQARVPVTTSRIGCENYAPNIDKNNGRFFGTFQGFTVPGSVTSNSTNRAWLEIALELTDSKSFASNSFVYWSYGNALEPNTPTDPLLFEKPATQSYASGFVSITPPNATLPVSYAGTVLSCTSLNCLAANYRLTAFVVVGTDTNTAVRQPFPLVEDAWSWDNDLLQNQAGLSAYINLVTPAAIYAKIDTFFSFSVAGVVYQKDTPFTGSTFPAADTATLKRFPNSATQPSGDYSTGPVSLTAGMWYATPFMLDPGPTGGSATVKVAYAINHEPGTNPAGSSSSSSGQNAATGRFEHIPLAMFVTLALSAVLSLC
jgi:hypothetical protein